MMKETIDLLGKILTNILTALYEPFDFSLLLSFLAMFFYLYAYKPIEAGKGWKNAMVTWYREFKESIFFRKLFFLAFVTSLILFRTLLNRNLWMNPLSNVMDGWSIWETVNGEQKLTTECIENVIMMVPFSAVVMWTNRRKKIIEKKVSADYIRGVKLIQKAMQWEISEKGIAIETNSSSNYMIGTFSKYDQHPITTFYNNGLTSERELLKSSSQIWVSINTDDQGIFNIKLENEYAFIARALEKKVDENGEKMYSKSMIYDWLDKIRKMGLNQSFLTVNDDANDKLPENARTEQYTV